MEFEDEFGAEDHVDIDVATLGLDDALDVTTKPPTCQDRRRAPRKRVSVLFNKYVDGTPFVAEALEVSATGMLVRRIAEPDLPQACYAVEIGAPDGPARWLCATRIWRDGDFEALSFVAHSEADRAHIASI